MRADSLYAGMMIERDVDISSQKLFRRNNGHEACSVVERPRPDGLSSNIAQGDEMSPAAAARYKVCSILSLKQVRFTAEARRTQRGRRGIQYRTASGSERVRAATRACLAEG